MNKTQSTRRTFLKTAASAAAVLSTVAPTLGAKQEKPNIVLILVDDLGWADIGCFGSTYYETPNIDRLASQGIKFTDGYAACAVCSPTRAAVMTGRWPARLGVTDWILARFQGGNIPADKKNPSGHAPASASRKLQCPRNALWMELDEITIAEALRPAGYATCHIGKWHLGPDDQYPEKQGFDYNFGGCDYGQPPSYFDPYKNKNLENIPTLEPRKEGEYLTDREADEAARFIEKHKSQPFFLYLANYAVHTPIQAKKDLVEKYKAKPATQQKNAIYAAMIQSVDEMVGRVMEALDRAGVARETLLIFTGDNGGLVPVTNNAPLRSGKGYPYEGGIREPTIVRWPEVARAGAECSTPVSSVDYFPTICQAAGVPLPTDRPIDGESLMPLIRGTGGLKRDALFWHFPHYRNPDVPYSIVRQGDWKLIKRYEGKEFELFNLKDDLSEKNDLAIKMPQKVKEINATLLTFLKDTKAKMPIPNPNYRPKS